MTQNIALEKYAFEIRYPPLVSAFDRRGEVLDKIWRPFESKAKHWRVENVAVSIQDKEETPSKLIHISHTRSFITYETPGSEDEFNNDAKKFVKLLISTFPEIALIERAGYRHIQFIGDNTGLHKHFSVIKPWLKSPLPTTLPINDALVLLEHENGRIKFGSTKASDKNLEQHFPNYNAPEEYYGVLIDIDSWTNDISLTKGTNLGNIFSAAQDATKATSIEILKSLGY